MFHHDRNQGPAAARNLGIKAAQSPLIVFVGDDILPERDFLQEHLNAHRENDNVETAILGHISWPKDMPINSLMKHIDGMGAEQFSYFYFKNQQEYDYRHFYTANISIKREMLFKEDRWFDTDFPYAAYEDVELSYRLSKRGMKIIYNEKPVGYHYHYHQIWSFTERQYRAGLMAMVLGNKHPQVRPLVLGKNWLLHLWLFWINSILKPVSGRHAADLERKIMLMTSAFEWSPNLITDGLYIRLLHHFYYKGIVQAVFSKTSFIDPVLNTYIVNSLSEISDWYKGECIRNNLPFSENFALFS